MAAIGGRTTVVGRRCRIAVAAAVVVLVGSTAGPARSLDADPSAAPGLVAPAAPGSPAGPTPPGDPAAPPAPPGTGVPDHPAGADDDGATSPSAVPDDGPAAAATLTVTPDRGLQDGQPVEVRFTASPTVPSTTIASLGLLQCAADAEPLRPERCRAIPGGLPPAPPPGTAATTVLIDDRFTGDPLGGGPPAEIDCRTTPGGCLLVATGHQTWVTAPIHFAPAGPGRRYADRVFDDVEVTRDITFGRAVGHDGVPVDLRLDLHEPAGDTAARRPAVIYAHGGFFAFGSRREGSRVADELARRGYVAVTVDYRLFPGATHDPTELARALPAARHDLQAAVRWLRANAERYRIGPEAIGAMGYSAGAISALGVATGADDPGHSGNPGHPSHIAGAVSLAGVNGRISPDMPPILLFHGTEDTTVPYDAAVASCEAVKVAGRSCQLVAYPGVDHRIYGRYADFLPKTVRFFGVTVVPALDRPPAGPPPPSTAVPTPTTRAGGVGPRPVPVPATPRYAG